MINLAIGVGVVTAGYTLWNYGIKDFTSLFGRIIAWCESLSPRVNYRKGDNDNIVLKNLENRQIFGCEAKENPRVMELLRNMVIPILNDQNTVLKEAEKKTNKSFSIIYNQDEPVNELFFKCVRGFQKINRLNLFDRLMEISAAKNIFVYNQSRSEVDNATVIWKASLDIIYKHLLMKKVKAELVRHFTFEQTNIIANILPTLGKAIKRLEEIKDHYYLSLFRVLLDTNTTWQKKAQFVETFFGDTYNEENALDILFSRYPKAIANMSIGFNELQFLLNYLNKMMHLPKNLHNLQIVENILKKSQQFYDQLAKLPHANRHKPTPFLRGNMAILTCLNGLLEDFKQAKGMVRKAKANRGNLSLKLNGPNTVKNTGNKKESKDFDESITYTPKDEKTEKGKDKGKDILEEKVKQKSTKISERKVEKKMFAYIDEGKFEENEIGDGDEFKQETNKLLETLRQFCEQRRKDKLEAQEEKRCQAKGQVSNDTDQSRPGMVIVEKLNSKQEQTLKALFSKTPLHLEIKGSDVKNLIRNGLKSTVEGNGNGSYVISWGNSTKSAGTFEMTHGGDKGKRLTGGYVARVREIIKKGIEEGFISIPPYYLNG